MPTDYDFLTHLTRFCRGLRDYGLLVGPSEVADALSAVNLVDLMDRGSVYRALRSLLVSRHDEIVIFDQLFERFWRFEPPPKRPAPHLADGPFSGERRPRPVARPALLPEHDERAGDPRLQALRTGASQTETTGGKDLTVLGADELADLLRTAARMVRALASRPGRRRRRHRRKGTLDMRGVLRVNLGSGGEPIRLPRRRRVPRVPRLLVILDVSGSMDRHARLLLQLVYAMVQQTSRVETFVFSTSVTRVTRQLKAPSFGEALRRVSRAVDHWSGGTRIGESLAGINAEYEPLQTRYTTVFLLSDGWETGDPEVLGRQLRRMRRRVRCVVWLNPLLGTPGYEPLTRGLQVVRPYVDHFVSAMDVAHLKRLSHLLGV